MISTKLAAYVGPEGREPVRIVVSRNETHLLLVRGRLPVSTGFAQEQNMLQVVLYHPIGQVGLSEKAAGLGGFKSDVRDLPPANGSQVVKADATGTDLDIG